MYYFNVTAKIVVTDRFRLWVSLFHISKKSMKKHIQRIKSIMTLGIMLE